MKNNDNAKLQINGKDQLISLKGERDGLVGDKVVENGEQRY